MPGAPELKQFRIEWSANRVVHLVFDMPGRSMNVFSNAAIEELGRSRTRCAVAGPIAAIRALPMSRASSSAPASPRHFAPALIWPSWKPRTTWSWRRRQPNATASRSIISSG